MIVDFQPRRQSAFDHIDPVSAGSDMPFCLADLLRDASLIACACLFAGMVRWQDVKIEGESPLWSHDADARLFASRDHYSASSVAGMCSPASIASYP